MDSPVSTEGRFDLINQPVDKVGKVSARVGTSRPRLSAGLVTPTGPVQTMRGWVFASKLGGQRSDLSDSSMRGAHGSAPWDPEATHTVNIRSQVAGAAGGHNYRSD